MRLLQILSQDYCGLAAAMVAAHHTFPQSCCARIRQSTGTPFCTARLFPQILSQNCCGLAGAVVAAHHLLAAFLRSCCEAVAAVVAAHHLFARGLLLCCWRFFLRVGCFGCAFPAGPPFLQSTRPVLFLFWWLVLQSLLCVLPLPSKTRLSRVCWGRYCSRAVCWGPYCSWAAPPAVG